MASRFSDLHCHPTLYSFNRFRNGEIDGDPDTFHPWNIPPSDTSSMLAGERATAYSQIDFAKMVKSGVRLVYASITPIEVGFFRGSPEPALNTNFAREAIGLASGATALRGMLALLQDGQMAALHKLTAILRNEGPARIALQKFVLKYSTARLKFMLSDEYDYWDEFLREYAFYKAKDGVRSHAEIATGAETRERVEGIYHLIKDAAQLEQVIADDEIAVVLTIEGAHTFSIGPDQERVDEDELFERVHTLKSLPHPILFVTLAHHFDNGLCGHARSIPDIGHLVMDQTRRMGEDLEPEGDLGKRVVLEMLDLDGDLKDKGGRRILLDVKHMSPRARRTYYREIVEPYNAARDEDPSPDKRPPISVVMSHMAYASVETLDDFVANEDKENKDWHINISNAWGINACAEDVRVIHRSGGLMGLVFDQRMLGLRGNENLPEELLPGVVIDHILAVVDVVMLDDRLTEEEKATIWDCVCIGSDFDGVIDPIACYPTALTLPDFAEDLRAALTRLSHTRQIAAIGVDKIVEKVCFGNGYAFAMRHLAG